jgi:hypothetical protein
MGSLRAHSGCAWEEDSGNGMALQARGVYEGSSRSSSEIGIPHSLLTPTHNLTTR